MQRSLLFVLMLTHFLFCSSLPVNAVENSSLPGKKQTKSSTSLKEQEMNRNSVKHYFPPDPNYQFLREMLMTDTYQERRQDQAWNEMSFKFFKLSLSSMLMNDSAAREYLRSTWEFNPSKSALPDNLFFRGAYGDTLRSIGGVIEPEIKIKIEF